MTRPSSHKTLDKSTIDRRLGKKKKMTENQTCYGCKKREINRLPMSYVLNQIHFLPHSTVQSFILLSSENPIIAPIFSTLASSGPDTKDEKLGFFFERHQEKKPYNNRQSSFE